MKRIEKTPMGVVLRLYKQAKSETCRDCPVKDNDVKCNPFSCIDAVVDYLFEDIDDLFMEMRADLGDDEAKAQIMDAKIDPKEVSNDPEMKNIFELSIEMSRITEDIRMSAKKHGEPAHVVAYMIYDQLYNNKDD